MNALSRVHTQVDEHRVWIDASCECGATARILVDTEALTYDEYCCPLGCAVDIAGADQEDVARMLSRHADTLPAPSEEGSCYYCGKPDCECSPAIEVEAWERQVFESAHAWGT